MQPIPTYSFHELLERIPALDIEGLTVLSGVFEEELDSYAKHEKIVIYKLLIFYMKTTGEREQLLLLVNICKQWQDMLAVLRQEP